MGKKSKIGRQRKDRFYQLAKETGYRSRAAFKLLQLNRKYEFLHKARVLIDLCAAPGGWMQVAKQNMPVSSIVIGVDMYPMKPVPGCISLLEDITTDKCRISLQKELKTWKADVILHDGAPNLGKNWLHDAYNQNCLTLSALKLATSFLKEGGWFISKVFRSKDYNCLLWAFKQLFKKVHATKPSASRNESAEIFVICQYYISPTKIDSRLLNPNYVFKELVVQTPITIQSLLKNADSTKKAKSEGYPDDTSLLHVRLPASVFISSESPAVILQNAYEIVMDDIDILHHPKTTSEIKKCCEDIKVLGKKELRLLICWWKALRDDMKVKESEEKNNSNDVAVNVDCTDKENKEVDSLSEEEKELNEVSGQINEMINEERREEKRKRKKINKQKTKLQVKMNLKMRQKEDLGPTEEIDREMFQLSQITSEKCLNKMIDQKPDTLAESDDEDESVKKPKKIKYDVENTYLDDSGLYYKAEDNETKNETDDEIDSSVESLGIENEENIELNNNNVEKPTKRVRFKEPFDDADQKIENELDENEMHPLLTDLDHRTIKDKRLFKANLWFDKDIFKNIENEEDEDFELDKMIAVITEKGGKIIGADKNCAEKVNDNSDKSDIDSNKSQVEKENKLTSIKKQNDDHVEPSNKRIKLSEATKINEWDIDDKDIIKEKKRKKKEKRTLDSKALALGSLMISSNKIKRDIIDDGWNRYAFNDENLPEWFVEDEKKHMHKEVPVPTELVNEYNKSREELNVRPIKKVMEAKARKKKRSLRKMEKMKKKLEGVIENPDMTSAEKFRQARQMYKKIKPQKPDVTYIVSKKHTAAKRIRRPKGVKGPYRVVDPRLKKDVRSKINKEMKNKSNKAAKKFKKSFKKKNKKNKRK